MDDNKDIEMATKPSSDKDKRAESDHEDRPPTPPKRELKPEDKSKVTESDGKRKRTGLFPRPEVIYKPEITKSSMSCLKNLLILINLVIWLFGAALTGIGIWIKVDEEFWEIQTGLDMKQFTTASYILIAAGVIIMVIGFAGCYGAFSQSLCLLIVYAIVIVLIILMELAVMVMVWATINNKDAKEEIKAKAKEAMQDMAKHEAKLHFLNLMQAKLKCCGVDGPDDYKEEMPPSCTDPESSYPYTQGCLESILKYLKSKAGVLGGIAVAVFILQLIALFLTIWLACGIKQAASNAIF